MKIKTRFSLTTKHEFILPIFIILIDFGRPKKIFNKTSHQKLRKNIYDE